MTAWRKLKWTTIVLALVVLGVASYRAMKSPTEMSVPENELRMPVANPPLEPDRPDLIGEPRPGQLQEEDPE